MMRGITPPVSPRRRAGLEAPQYQVTVRWDGKVPEEHRDAFGHKLLPPGGEPVIARWRDGMLFSDSGGHWWIEGHEGAHLPSSLSRDGWGYAGPLYGAGGGRAEGTDDAGR